MGMENTIDYNQAVTIADDVYWVGQPKKRS